jgi:uncharacterized protein (TIGR00645 family)
VKRTNIRIDFHPAARCKFEGATPSVRIQVPAFQSFQMMNSDQSPTLRTRSLAMLGSLIFLSRWLQAPLYIGLIVAQGVYVYHFLKELWHLVHEAPVIDETNIMMTVLGLIDVVMIANLLIMVIVGGYETFVSRLNLEGHPDQPEWLSHVNAGVLKVKLATALIGISSVHLLQTFIEISTKPVPDHTVMWQLLLHLTFVFSALMLAVTDRISTQSAMATRALPDHDSHAHGENAAATSRLADRSRPV